MVDKGKVIGEGDIITEICSTIPLITILPLKQLNVNINGCNRQLDSNNFCLIFLY